VLGGQVVGRSWASRELLTDELDRRFLGYGALLDLDSCSHLPIDVDRRP